MRSAKRHGQEEAHMDNLLLIRNSRTFMVNALITNLESAGFVVKEVILSRRMIEAAQQDVDLMILYADEHCLVSPDHR